MSRKRKKKVNKRDDMALIVCAGCKKLVINSLFCVYCGNQLHPLGWRRKGVG